MWNALNFATALFSAQDERTLKDLTGHLIEKSLRASISARSE